ncbi:hypothetical protein PQE75_gp071 [Bacillus phage vB_BcoS-136]|uniref:Uncharacterized protein n=1 Tax=Bacillus phage vB_BcoS-136 TaxID=2419619 RepID=A0A3G3BVD6_9CAUD|nr:hypothetical protein PQE75_gp071 [Bacillus phage vB_BcoS-136]AYP68203.1 hypothetical protein vBBcoS136_00071 [Bacillus phage vB_BcoS-136]
MEKLKELKTLDGMFTLKEIVKIYVPSTFDVNVKIVNDRYVREIERKMSSLFGGSTTMETKGSYVASTGVLVQEKINIVYSFTNELDNVKIDEVINMCLWLKKEMKQECISLEVNGKLHFIE